MSKGPATSTTRLHQPKKFTKICGFPVPIIRPSPDRAAVPWRDVSNSAKRLSRVSHVRAGNKTGRCPCADSSHCSRSASDSRPRLSPRRRRSRRRGCRAGSHLQGGARPGADENLAGPARRRRRPVSRNQGKSAAAVASLKTVSEKRSARTGITHVRIEQRVDGRAVYGAYVKAAFNEQGQLVHVIENVFARVSRTGSRAASIDDGRRCAPRSRPRRARGRGAALVGRDGATSRRSHAARSSTPPHRRARRVVPMEDGSLHNGFLVTTWTDKEEPAPPHAGQRRGEVLTSSCARTTTSTSSTRRPGQRAADARQRSGPGDPAGTAPSPAGWLGTGTHNDDQHHRQQRARVSRRDLEQRTATAAARP